MNLVRHFIGGQLVDSLDGKTFESTSPIDYTARASLAESSAAVGKAFDG